MTTAATVDNSNPMAESLCAEAYLETQRTADIPYRQPVAAYTKNLILSTLMPATRAAYGYRPPLYQDRTSIRPANPKDSVGHLCTAGSNQPGQAYDLPAMNTKGDVSELPVSRQALNAQELFSEFDGISDV